MSKTKKVAGVDLSASSFAYVGDENDTATWVLPIHVPSDRQKTVNLIKSALFRVASAKIVPESAREKVFLKIAGAAQAYGISVGAQPKPSVLPGNTHPVDGESVEMKAALAVGELAAQRFLKQIGY